LGGAIAVFLKITKEKEIMRKLLILTAVFAVVSAIAFACDHNNDMAWGGKLLDARCYDRHQTIHGCEARTSSLSFVLLTDQGKVFRFTRGSNEGISRLVEANRDAFGRNHGPVWARVKGRINSSGRISTDMVEIA
jgi:hypothetical protein